MNGRQALAKSSFVRIGGLTAPCTYRFEVVGLSALPLAASGLESSAWCVGCPWLLTWRSATVDRSCMQGLRRGLTTLVPACQAQSVVG